VTADTATEQLVRVHEYTDERGYATAEIVAEPSVSEGQLSVPVELLTTGERHTLRFPLPTTWSEEYRAVRFVESVGYGPGGIELLVGERFPVEIPADGDAALEPVFDPDDPPEPDRTVAGVSLPDLSRETVGHGAVGALRFAGRSARYAVMLAAFSLVVSVAALVAATITYAVVLGGFLVSSLAGTVGTIGLLLPTLLVVFALRVRFSRGLGSRLRTGATRGAGRSGPELHRHR